MIGESTLPPSCYGSNELASCQTPLVDPRVLCFRHSAVRLTALLPALNRPVGYNFALPLSHLLLAKTLEMYTSLRPTGPLYDHISRARHRRFDLCVAILGPILGILLHLSTMDRRFYLVEKFGPMPATWWDTWGVIWMAVSRVDPHPLGRFALTRADRSRSNSIWMSRLHE